MNFLTRQIALLLSLQKRLLVISKKKSCVFFPKTTNQKRMHAPLMKRAQNISQMKNSAGNENELHAIKR